jgi:hypothetical protein
VAANGKDEGVADNMKSRREEFEKEKAKRSMNNGRGEGSTV